MPISKIKGDAINDDAITSDHLGLDVIVAEDLAANSITVSEISDDAVQASKLSGLTNSSSGIIQADGDGTFSTTVADMVNDTTPQLGGDLDLNSSDITGTGNIDTTTETVTLSNTGHVRLTLAADTDNAGGEDNGSPRISITQDGLLTQGTFQLEGSAGQIASGTTENGLVITTGHGETGSGGFEVVTGVQYSNSNDGSLVDSSSVHFRVDGTGSIDLPEQPRAQFYYMGSSETLSNNLILAFDTTAFNKRITVSNSNRNFQVPSDGVYLVNANISGAATGANAGDGLQIRLLKNGSVYGNDRMYPLFNSASISGYEWQSTWSILVEMSGSDYIQIEVEDWGSAPGNVSYRSLGIVKVT